VIGRLPKPKRNPHSGRKPRANPFLRAWRLARRKRVAYARAQACDTLAHAQKQIARYEALAKAWNVPVDAMEPLPPVPNLPVIVDTPAPGRWRTWVNFLRDMGELKAPVIVPQPEPQTQAMA
jgi:hypothetical protein